MQNNFDPIGEYVRLRNTMMFMNAISNGFGVVSPTQQAPTAPIPQQSNIDNLPNYAASIKAPNVAPMPQAQPPEQNPSAAFKRVNVDGPDAIPIPDGHFMTRPRDTWPMSKTIEYLNEFNEEERLLSSYCSGLRGNAVNRSGYIGFNEDKIAASTIHGVAIAKDETGGKTLAPTMIVNTANCGLRHVVVDPDNGKIIDILPVNTPVVLGSDKIPNGIFIPFDKEALELGKELIEQAISQHDYIEDFSLNAVKGSLQDSDYDEYDYDDDDYSY